MKNITVIFFLLSSICHSQKGVTYTNLETALKTPNKVFWLSLEKQQLKVFPSEILKFPNLVVLNISHNKLSDIPEEIRQLKNLK